jgi:dolichol kinase
MTIITTGTFAMECLRYRPGFGWMNDVLSFCLGGTLRKHEMEGKFTGSFYYFLGVVITARAFPTSCASLGIMQLALADPAASYFGRKTKNVYWSRIENGFFGIGRNKGVLGFLGGALVCFPFNFYALSIAKIHVGAATTVTTASIAAASLVLGLAGGFADLCVPSPALTMPKKICGVPMLPLHVDDNIVVPIFSGFACTKIFEYLGWGAAGVDLARFIII